MKEEKKSKFWQIVNVVFVALVFVGLISYILIFEGWNNVLLVMKTINYWWLIAGVVLTVSYWLLEGLCFYSITKSIYPDQKFIGSFRLAMIGRLFNNITPFSTGDQPAQLVTMKNEGKSISNSLSILLTRFLVYQAVLIVFTFVILLFRYTFFESYISNLMYLSLIGFVINTIVIIFFIMIIVNEKFVFKVGKFILGILEKIKIVKHEDVLEHKYKESLDNFKEQLLLVKEKKMVVFLVSIYTLIELIVLYSITYVVYRSFGYNSTDYATIISAQTILNLITIWMPTPGASGTAEGGFHIIFKNFMPANVIALSILFWRFFTFYLPIIVGALFMIKKSDKNKSIAKENTQ